MKVVQVGKPGGNFEIVERPVPEPGRTQVRIKVEACGICHSDVLVKEGMWPGLQYPRVPGHEVAGKIDAVGAAVTQFIFRLCREYCQHLYKNPNLPWL